MQPAKHLTCPYCAKPLIGGAAWNLYKCADTDCPGNAAPISIKPTQRPHHAKRRP